MFIFCLYLCNPKMGEMKIVYISQFSAHFSEYEKMTKEERRELAHNDPEAEIFEPEDFASWFNFGRFARSGRIYII